MPIEFTMPKLGHLMEEGTIISWKKREGDRIEKGEILLEIETEKAAIEMESDMSGILLKIIVREGGNSGGWDAPGGGWRGSRAMTGFRVSPMRRAIARITAQSFAEVPHFYLRVDVDAGGILGLREQLLEQMQKDFGVRITITDFLLRAMALALKACPYANRIWLDDGIVELSTIDIGLVVGLQDGLLIPVVRSADSLDLASLAQCRSELVASAKSGRLPAGASQSGATSLSNLGNIRVDEISAIIYPPQSSMLAVGRIAERPFVVDGELCVRL